MELAQSHDDLEIAWEESVVFRPKAANCDKFLQLGTVIGMGKRFPNSNANKVRSPSGGLFALNPIWPLVERICAMSLQMLCVIPLFTCFLA